MVARAARIVRDRQLDVLEDELVRAFARFCTDPVRRDPSCAAKLAILEALDVLDHLDIDTYAQAARLTQLEPAWGPPVDTAPPVRARAALALGRAVSPSALVLLGELLGDDAAVVRRAATEALAQRGGPGASALLALRFRVGDPDPVAFGECAAALVRLSPELAIARIATMIRAPGADRALLGYALAESRAPAALAALEAWLGETIFSKERAPIIAMIAAHRTDEAERLLLELVEDGGTEDAALAVAALGRRAITESARGRLLDAASHTPTLLAAARRALAEGPG